MYLTVLGFTLIFLATTAGSALVYCFRGDISKRTNSILLGFAAGVMIAASVWSLIIPSLEGAESTLGRFSWIPAAISFLLGGLFVMLLDHVIPHLHAGSNHEEGPHSSARKSTKLFLAVIEQNICLGSLRHFCKSLLFTEEELLIYCFIIYVHSHNNKIRYPNRIKLYIVSLNA